METSQTNKWLSMGVTPSAVRASIEADRLNAANANKGVMVIDIDLPLWVIRLYQIEAVKLDTFTASTLAKYFQETRRIATNFLSKLNKHVDGILVSLGNGISENGKLIKVYKLRPNWKSSVRTYLIEHYPSERAARLLQLITQLELKGEVK
jgi:hypothetical protein